ncbi:probable carotenoid cleavage dioxygenase 4, chloroplastic [Telopea speciosissima]|uniref:probable carotenoid cleavage dioxygenase 4, chloroplastic n=1 Tax=Telopea speciosissima TaxID=54955 RepID=UPI001CC47430|nr:probable carotenoid cleavage dioxygenase 4, chloroplastic [Telopea speciosissima]
MDSFSLSFLSTLQYPKLLSSTTNKPTTIPSPHIPTFHVSSVRIEEQKPQQTTPPPPPQIKRQQPSNPKAAPLPSTKANSTIARTTLSSTKATTITTTRRRTEPHLPTILFHTLDDIINNFIDPPLRPSVDPRLVLADNFSPVEELPPTDCPVIEGHLPSCLDGAYIRNGPNPQYLPRGPYHLFDGDGMLHSLRISDCRATLCSRYVKTYKYYVERNAGSPVFPNVFSGFHGLTATIARGALSAARVLSGEFNPANGIGLANTSLAFFGNRLFALGESDLPYTVRLTPDGDIETIGRHDFDEELFMSMTAHPKIDPDTGETFAFRYGPVPPFLTFFRFNPDGSKQPDVPIFSMTSPSFLHDFGITKKYAIFPDIQLGMNPTEMIFGGGSPVGSDLGKVPRIGVIPRYAKDESQMRWFEVPGFNIIHAINAWDEDEDVIVMIAPNILSVEHTLERTDLVHASVEKVRIDLKTGIVTRFPVSARNLDFGVINPGFMGKKIRYSYLAIGDPMPKISGVVKLDVSGSEHKECTVACRMFGEGCYGGEPFFVAREPGNCHVEAEDDGYLVTYVHDENTGESRFLVMDAKSPSLEIVAAVKLPRRVPYGFHGLFVRESDLQKL